MSTQGLSQSGYSGEVVRESRPMYRIGILNRLAFPKGKIPKCELTGLPATVECVTPHITLYYATEEHAEQAWHGIIYKIAPLLGPLRATPPIIGSEEERARREYTVQTSKRALIDLCQQEASKFLVQGRYDLAIPGAIQALAFSQEIFGNESLEMVPPYLLLSEANLGLGRLQTAEELLSMANWSILKSPNCSNAIRSQLHRNFGKLHTAQNKLPEALEELSRDIYCSSLEAGPEHIDTSAGYFLMANIFYAQRKVESSLAFYDKVVDIWYKFLVSVRGDSQLADSFGEAQLSEGVDMLTRVLNTRVNLLGEAHIATGESKYTLGLLRLFMGEREEAMLQLTSAAEVYERHLGSDHASTKDVRSVLSQLGLPSPDKVERRRGAGEAPSLSLQGSESTLGGGGGLGAGVGGSPRAVTMSPEPLGAPSLLSQFPPTKEMPRAAPQSPIPLPPGRDRQQETGWGLGHYNAGDRAGKEREGGGGNAMQMSPPHGCTSGGGG